MTADLPVTAPPFSLPLTIQAPAGYFRSKLFASNAASNPLVAAASPILSILERLCISQTLPAIEIMRENLEHELFAFQSRLSHQQYTDETNALAYYLVSATMDELLGKNYLRVYGQSVPFKAFTPNNPHILGPESQFFVIIHQLQNLGSQHLDLLELAYYCLIAGFEGEQHLLTNGRQILENLMEDLHKTIQRYRVYTPQLLFKTSSPKPEMPVNRYKPLITPIILGLTMLIVMYYGCQALLNHQAKNIVKSYTTQIKTDV